MSELQHLRIERTDFGAWVIVDRPQVLNALDCATLAALDGAIAELSADAGVRVIALTGAGERAFIAGADIAEMSALTPAGMAALLELGQGVTRRIEDAPQPVIAAVNGYALGGGCEIALAADLVIAAETARFGQPEVKLGIPPGFGGTQRLPRRVGFGRASELILTGRMVAAEEALRIGLCERVVPLDRLRAEVETLARELASLDAGALAAAKRAIRAGWGASRDEGLRDEAAVFLEAFDRPERVAAMRAFLQRR